MTNPTTPGASSLQISHDQVATARTEAEEHARTEAAANAGSKWSATSQVVGSVTRVTARTDTDTGEQSVTREIADGVTRVTSADLQDTSGAPRFHSSGGRTLATNEVTPESLVTVEGQTMSVRTAVHIGFLRQNESGAYVSASGVAPSTKDAAKEYDAAQAQREAEQARTENESVQIEPLDREAETILSEVVTKVSEGTSHAVLNSVLETGSISPAMAEQVAEQLGVSPEQAVKHVEKLRASFKEQASRAAGVSDMADVMFAWAEVHQPKALQAAIREQVVSGKTDGYKALGRAYITNLPSIDPDAILQSPAFAALGARRERNGEITLDLPRVGRVAWGVALKAGLINPQFQR